MGDGDGDGEDSTLTSEILTSKPTFIQGVSEKLLKTRNTNRLQSTHLYGVKDSSNFPQNPGLVAFPAPGQLSKVKSRPPGQFYNLGIILFSKDQNCVTFFLYFENPLLGFERALDRLKSQKVDFNSPDSHIQLNVGHASQTCD